MAAKSQIMLLKIAQNMGGNYVRSGYVRCVPVMLADVSAILKQKRLNAKVRFLTSFYLNENDNIY